jgi:hypothetical protein
MSSISGETERTADEIADRLLGNAKDFKVLETQERPRKYFVTGVVYPRVSAEAQSYQVYRSKITPNSYSLDIAVNSPKFKLIVIPSFWVWFESRLLSRDQAFELADEFDERTIWASSWKTRFSECENKLKEITVPSHEDEDEDDSVDTPLHSFQAEEKELEEMIDPEDIVISPKKRLHIRKRFSESLEFEIDATGKDQLEPVRIDRELSLSSFRNAWAALGRAPAWTGKVHVRAWIDPEDQTARARITIENTYGEITQGEERMRFCPLCKTTTTQTLSKKESGQIVANCKRCGTRNSFRQKLQGEPCWFDARALITTDHDLRNFPAKFLDQSVRATTVNCTLDNKRNSSTKGNVVYVEQIGKVVTPRRKPATFKTFMEVSEDPLASSRELLEFLSFEKIDTDTLEHIEHCVAVLEQDQLVRKAVSATSRTLQFSFKPTDGWKLFQLTTFLVGVDSYFNHSGSIPPIVLNVPTASGKTETFDALMLFAYFYNALHGGRAISHVKYPFRMVSIDQQNRLAKYIVNASRVSREIKVDPPVLGFFAGKSAAEDEALPRTIIQSCPVCKKSWNDNPKQLVDRPGNERLECEDGHELAMAVGDCVFHVLPAVIISTPDKFVAKCTQREMGAILGAKSYRCAKHGFTTYSVCDVCKADLSKSASSTRLAYWTLDESHMIREEMGSLDSHFEKALLDIVQYNTGRYPVVVLSTATISGITNFCKQLGLQKPIIVPKADYEGVFFPKDETDKSVQHVVLAIEPRDRAVVFALGRVVTEWANVLELHGIGLGRNTKPTGSSLADLSQLMLYFPSHDKLHQTEEAIINNVNRERGSNNRNLPPLKYINVTGRDTDDRIRNHVDKINERDQDLVLATAIASVGIDINSLNAIAFYGVPSNVSEFVQVVNRTARSRPGVVFLILDPGKERDRTYYDYLELFLGEKARARLIEEIPINRYARNAINYTFSSIVTALLLFYYGPKNGKDYRRASEVLGDLSSGLLDEIEIVQRIKQVYLAEDDESGQYEKLINGNGVRGLWDEFKANLQQQGVVRIWDYYFRTNIKYPMLRSLRAITDRNVLVASDALVQRAIAAKLRAARTTSGDDSLDEDEGTS